MPPETVIHLSSRHAAPALVTVASFEFHLSPHPQAQIAIEPAAPQSLTSRDFVPGRFSDVGQSPMHPRHADVRETCTQADYNPDPTKTVDLALANPDVYPDLGGMPKGATMKSITYWGAAPDPAKYMPAVVDQMLNNGYSEEDCHKVLGGNFMRVFEQVWRAQVARRRERESGFPRVCWKRRPKMH